MNFIFGLSLHYYNGPSIYAVDLVRKVSVQSYGYDFAAELLIRCLKLGSNYKQVPFIHRADNEQNSKALKLKNFVSVAKTLKLLITDIYFKKAPQGLC